MKLADMPILEWLLRAKTDQDREIVVRYEPVSDNYSPSAWFICERDQPVGNYLTTSNADGSPWEWDYSGIGVMNFATAEEGFAAWRRYCTWEQE